MASLGTNLARSGHELINLSEIYAVAKTDSDELRRDIEKAFRAVSAALVSSRYSSGDDLFKIRLEPMYLCDHALRRLCGAEECARFRILAGCPHLA
jgi:hypothetical protein